MSRESATKQALVINEDLTQKYTSDMVVTINKDGSPLSRFGDDIWNYGAVSSTIRSLNFRLKIEGTSKHKAEKIIDESRLAASCDFTKGFTLQWLSVLGGCSMSKLNGDLTAISFLVRYCLDNSIDNNDIFTTPDAIDFLTINCSTSKQAGLFLGKVQRMADTATTLGSHIFWHNLQPSTEFLNKLKRARKSFPETTDSVQTLVIPSDIYQRVIKRTIEDLELFLEYEDTITYLFSIRTAVRNKVVCETNSPFSNNLTKKQKVRLNYKWKLQVLENSQVANALAKLETANISNNKNWSGLVDALNNWQLRCAIIIAAFTGMRKGELLAIPLNGLNSISTDSGPIPVVWSTTTKLEPNGAPRFTKWVTSSIVKTAFDVARIITKGALSFSDAREPIDLNEGEIPLFFSTEHGKKGIPHPCFRFTTTNLNLSRLNESLFSEELRVSEQDLAEVQWFLYGENVPATVVVNKAWPLTLHQFRRSMAVYAAASGRVSYPVLKAQLKHISTVMTTYYADSNSRALNILGNDAEVKAMRAEWTDAKARAEADDLNELIQSGQPLAGSAGKKLRMQQQNNELPQFLESRITTKKAVKQGKFRYRPTLVGGCVSLVPCNNGAGVLASACISCENAIFVTGSKVALEQTKDFYEAVLSEGAPKRARQEYESNIKKIDNFLQRIVETVEMK